MDIGGAIFVLLMLTFPLWAGIGGVLIYRTLNNRLSPASALFKPIAIILFGASCYWWMSMVGIIPDPYRLTLFSPPEMAPAQSPTNPEDAVRPYRD
jgi:hypothetical protein